MECWLLKQIPYHHHFQCCGSKWSIRTKTLKLESFSLVQSQKDVQRASSILKDNHITHFYFTVSEWGARWISMWHQDKGTNNDWKEENCQWINYGLWFAEEALLNLISDRKPRESCLDVLHLWRNMRNS